MSATGEPAEHRTSEWFEQQYNPRLSVPDAALHFARWGAWSAETRAAGPYQADIAYGPHPREVFDLFRADTATGLVIFLHGGYWRALSKAEHSFVAGPLRAAGYSVAVINYPLCPEVTVAAIADSCRRAIAALWPRLTAQEQRNVLVCGHSAGGYLTAAMLTSDWQALGLPAAPFTAGLSLSGIFALEPLIHTSMNETIRLTADQAAAWSMTRLDARVAVPFLLAVGEREPAEFHRQSRQLAETWALAPDAVLSIAGTDHFTIVEQLHEPTSEVSRLARRLLGAAEG